METYLLIRSPLFSTGWSQHPHHLQHHPVYPVWDRCQRCPVDDRHAGRSLSGSTDAADWLYSWIRHVSHMQTQSAVSKNRH